MSIEQSRIIHPADYWRSQTCHHIGTEGCWTESDISAQLALFDGWLLIKPQAGSVALPMLRKHCVFASFNELEPVLIRLLTIARMQDHHPDVSFGYREMTVSWSTHSAGGISDNDWICAALLDEVMETVKR